MSVLIGVLTRVWMSAWMGARKPLPVVVALAFHTALPLYQHLRTDGAFSIHHAGLMVSGASTDGTEGARQCPAYAREREWRNMANNDT